MSEALASDEWRKTPAKKDTRAWCKGRVGREHDLDVRIARWTKSMPRQPQCIYEPESFFADDTGWKCYHEPFCKVCGKIFWSNDFECPDRPTKEAHDA